MDSNWSLKELYDSFEGEAFNNDIKKIGEHIKKIKEWADQAAGDHEREKEKLEEYITLSQELMNLHEKLSSFTALTLSVDSKNEKAKKYDGAIEEKMSTLASTETKVSTWISEIKDLDKVIGESEHLKAHDFYIKEIVQNQKYRLSEKEEAIIARMKNTGSSAWASYKDLVIATHKVPIEIEGERKELPLTQVLNLYYDSNKEKRKKAYEAEIDAYKKIEEGVAAALNAIKGEALTSSQVRGYESPYDMTLKDSRLADETVEAMLTAVRESLPMFRKYLKKKAERLGYKNGLPFYELFAPVINAHKEFPFEEGRAFVEKNFAAFSPHLAEFAKKALDSKWIDIFPKEGKVGGAFCAGVHSIGESRIMLNYGGSLGDAITMAHELGHGFHNQCLKDESILNIGSPMPLAETASTFCELIVKKAAIKEADEEQALAILEHEISDASQVVVDIYSRFLFESRFFEARKEGVLSVEEIKDLMLKAQQEAYGDALDKAYFHPYMWTWKPHYYDADFNFYNFPYTFGLLFAKGLYVMYQKEKQTFPERYEKLLSTTGKKPVLDVLKEMNIDGNDPDFWKSSLKTIEEDIEAFIRLSDKIPFENTHQ